MIVNPALRLLEFSYKNLVPLVRAAGNTESVAPEPGEERILVWRKTEPGEVLFRTAREEDLLVLKIVLEETALETAAAVGGVPPAAIEGALKRAVGEGLLIAPGRRSAETRRLIPTASSGTGNFWSPRLLPSSGTSPRPATSTASIVTTAASAPR